MNTSKHTESRRTKTVSLGLLAFALLLSHPARAQVAFTGDYTQNFSSMGSGTTAPAGWSAVSEAGTHFVFGAPSSYDGSTSVAPNFTAGALSTSPIEYLTPTQASSTGKGVDGVNWVNTLATAQNGEGSESLGTDPSGNAATILELTLTNTTGQAINSLNVGYDIDRYTTVSNTSGNVPAGYPNTGLEDLPGYQLFYNLTPANNATWTNVSALNPTIDMGTTGPVQVPNTVGITVVNGVVTLSGPWAAGTTLDLAWFDDNASSPSPDQEIGLNNVSIEAAIPEPSSVNLACLGLGLVAFLAFRRRLQARP